MGVEDFHTLCLVRNNRNKIVSDNSHIMTVNGKLLYTLRASIDQPKAMLFAGRELEAGCSSVVLAGSSTTVTLLVYAQVISSKTQNLSGQVLWEGISQGKSGGPTRQAPHLSS